jgi:Fe-S-cluster-containing hydrogenase component 2
MTQKILMIDCTKCTGCRLCELVCSVKKVNASNPSRARVHVVKWEMQGLELPMLCQHCEIPPCKSICPAGAIYRDEQLGGVLIDYDKCIGCRMCVAVCPFGAMAMDTALKKVVKCDLCDGEPTCVNFCQPGALQYVEATTANLRKKREASLKFSELMRRFTGL